MSIRTWGKRVSLHLRSLAATGAAILGLVLLFLCAWHAAPWLGAGGPQGPEAREGIWHILAALAAGGLVTGAVLLLVQQRVVCSPLARLKTAVTRISARGDLSARIQFAGPGILGDVSREINALMESLERSEAAARLRDRQLRSALRAVGVGIWVYDAEENSVEWPDADESLLGIAPPSLPHTYEALLAIVHNDDMSELAGRIDKALIERGSLDTQFRIHASDGSIRWLRTYGGIVETHLGKAKRLMCTVRDITKFRNATQALNESQERYRGLVEGVQEMVLTLSADGAITSLNPAFEMTTGWPRDEWTGRAWLDLIHAEDRPLADELLQNAMAGRRRPLSEMRLLRRSGEYAFVEIGLTPHERDGGIVGVFALGRDVTERKQAEEDLRRRTFESAKRVRELNCLYAITKLIETPGATIEAVLQGAADLIPPAWQHPEIACARIVFEGREFKTEWLHVEKTTFVQSAAISVGGEQAGVVEVCYLAECAEADEGPFLAEERRLLEDIAERLSQFIERKAAEERIDHLNAVLRALRNISLLITHEPDRERLLMRACELLIETRGYSGAWVALREESGALRLLAHAGMDTTHPQFVDHLRSGTTPCCDVALRSEGVTTVVGEHPLCRACRLLDDRPLDRNMMLTRLEHLGKVSGVLGVVTSPTTKTDSEEMALFSDVAGDIAHALHTIEGETERRLAQEALSRLAAAVEQTDEQILITDPEGTIQYVNPAFERVTGYTRAEAVGETPRFLHSGRQDEKFYRRLWRTLKKGGVWSGHVVNRRKDGTSYEAESTISPVRDASGAICNYVAVTRDVTQQVLLEAQLLQAQKMESLGQLAAGIAHEINTPAQYVGDNTHFVRDNFAAIVEVLGQYGRLAESAKQGPVTPELLASIESAAADLSFVLNEIPAALDETLDGIERITKIVRAMKEFSHPGGDDKEHVDLNAAIQSTVTVARNEWKYVADVQMDLDPDLPSVPCLRGELNQVILNVLINAAHAVAEKAADDAKGTIAIRTRRDGDVVEIRIRDTGCGIPKEIQAKVFDPFFTTKAVGKGTGQGLAIAHNVVVNKHGGTITFETEPGEGTTFVIRLPIEAESVETRTETVDAA